MSVFRTVTASAACVVLFACATAQPAPPDTSIAPWSGPHLSASSVPDVYVTEWKKAENRATCAVIAPVSVAVKDAKPRRANFAGGWAVAYDTPAMRSAFGIAGAGVKADDSSYDEWPHQKQWTDGSTVGYGPEGGTGPNQLAYLRIKGQGCLYNVWSNLGVEHLEQLLESLRFVDSK